MNYSAYTTDELTEMANHGARRLSEMVRNGSKSKRQANEEFRQDILPLMKEVIQRREAKAA